MHLFLWGRKTNWKHRLWDKAHPSWKATKKELWKSKLREKKVGWNTLKAQGNRFHDQLGKKIGKKKADMKENLWNVELKFNILYPKLWSKSVSHKKCLGERLMGVPPLGNWLAESNQICQRCRILKDTYKMLSSLNQDAVSVLSKGKDSECINTSLDIRRSTKGWECTKKKFH